MLINTEDHDELRWQAGELLTLAKVLRPTPSARLMSHKMVMLIALLAENRDLVEVVKKADHRVLFWEVDGEYVQTRVCTEDLVMA